MPEENRDLSVVITTEVGDVMAKPAPRRSRRRGKPFIAVYKDGEVIGWIVTDAEQTEGNYTVYENSTYYDSGTWSNNTAINTNIGGKDPGGY